MAERTLIVSADDIGLSKGNTDTILETIDKGTITSVSILANGLAFDYAIAELKKRPNLRVSVHLNLTEGKSVSRVPHLTDTNGNFLHSPPGLSAAYTFASKHHQHVFENEVRQEVEAQIKKVKEALGLSSDTPIPVDGHQHVHVLSFVLDSILEASKTTPIAEIRIPDEPLFLARMPLSSYTPTHLFSVIARPFVMPRARREAARVGLRTTDAFVGILYSGHMFEAPAKASLASVAAHPLVRSAEILFHPGSALPGELDSWKGNTVWHYDEARKKERAFVMSSTAKELFELFCSGALRKGVNYERFLRYSISGTLAAATHLGGLYVLTEYARVWYVFSNIMGFSCGFIVSFMLQKFWTFEDSTTDRVHHQVFYYALAQGANLAINTLGLYLLATYLGVWYFLAEIMMLIAVATWNFFIFKRVIFKHHDR